MPEEDKTELRTRDELLAKLLVDLGLAIASYQVQMRWVFRVDQAEKGAVAEEAERL